MTVKSSITSSDTQDRFARGRVESEHFASLSSVLRHGADVLNQKTEAKVLEAAAFRHLFDRRASGPRVSSADMDMRIEQMIARKLRSQDMKSDSVRQ